jgi:hypothetical protein
MLSARTAHEQRRWFMGVAIGGVALGVLLWAVRRVRSRARSRRRAGIGPEQRAARALDLPMWQAGQQLMGTETRPRSALSSKEAGPAVQRISCGSPQASGSRGGGPLPRRARFSACPCRGGRVRRDHQAVAGVVIMMLTGRFLWHVCSPQPSEAERTHFELRWRRPSRSDAWEWSPVAAELPSLRPQATRGSGSEAGLCSCPACSHASPSNPERYQRRVVPVRTNVQPQARQVARCVPASLPSMRYGRWVPVVQALLRDILTIWRLLVGDCTEAGPCAPCRGAPQSPSEA